MKPIVVFLVVCALACKREPEANQGPPSAGSPATASGAAGRFDASLSAPRDALAAAAVPRMRIAAAKLELVGNSTIKALELSDSGEVRVGDKVYGTLSADGRFTRDGKVLAELGEDGQLLLGGDAADPPIRIDPEGDVFIDGELVMTIGDDGTISTVDKDGAITENVLALLEGPPQGRRAVAMLLVLVTTPVQKRDDPPPSTSGKVPEP